MPIKKKTNFLILGIIVVIIGIMIGIVPIFLQREIEIEENIKVEDYISSTSSFENIEKKPETNEEGYLLVLEIPKIGLKRGVYSKDSSLNTIDLNIAIMQESSLPDDENGNVVLEAHSGNSNVSYFDSLYKLGIGEDVFIYYQGTKYVYIVDDIYDVLKDGDVEVNRNLQKSTLTLITCKNNTDDRQSVFILYLSNKEEY